MALVDELLAKFQVSQDAANAANEQRYQEGLQIFDKMIGQYETGGTFEKATEATLARGEKKAVAQGTQSLVSSGLASTTTAAGLGKKYQEEVGEPARARAADVSTQRMNEALSQKAGFIERREDTGPGFAMIAELAKSIGAGAQASGGGGARRGGGGSGYDELSRLQSQNKQSGIAAQAASDARYAAQKADRPSTSYYGGGGSTQTGTGGGYADVPDMLRKSVSSKLKSGELK
jgi:hypothetical protein